ncbi:ABC transporter ATP-binding protein, partial [Streptomyces mobaraensis NBRC 13819 = DSM 40847]
VVHRPEHIPVADAVLRGFGDGGSAVEPHTRRITVPVSGGARLLAEIIRELDARDVGIDDIGLRRPTLDDVFISLTGHAAEGAGEPDGRSEQQRERQQGRQPGRRQGRPQGGDSP